jgi:hypothetical protein
MNACHWTSSHERGEDGVMDKMREGFSYADDSCAFLEEIACESLMFY